MTKLTPNIPSNFSRDLAATLRSRMDRTSWMEGFKSELRYLSILTMEAALGSRFVMLAFNASQCPAANIMLVPILDDLHSELVKNTGQRCRLGRHHQRRGQW